MSFKFDRFLSLTIFWLCFEKKGEFLRELTQNYCSFVFKKQPLFFLFSSLCYYLLVLAIFLKSFSRFHYLPIFYLSLRTKELVIVINYLLLCHCCCFQTKMFPLTSFRFYSFLPTFASYFYSHSKSYSVASSSSLYSPKAFQVSP